MKTKFQRLVIIVFSILCIGALVAPLSVQAGTEPTIVISGSTLSSAENTRITSTIASLNTEIKIEVSKMNSKDFISYYYSNGTDSSDKYETGQDLVLEVLMSKYKELPAADKQKVMEIALTTINNSQISKTNKTKLYNKVAELDESVSSLVRQLSDDVKGDFASGYNLFKPFSGVIGTILGALCLAIFIMLGISIIIDIAYITLPFIQIALADRVEKKSKVSIVSSEAIKAVEAAHNSAGTEYINPMGYYLKHKVKQFIALGICLLYLVSGQIYYLMAEIIDMFQGWIG